MGVFLDSGFYLGLSHSNDPHSDRSNEILLDLKTGKFGLLYTSNLIISEVTTLAFVRSKGNQKVMNNLYDLIWGKHRLATRLEVSLISENETWTLFDKLNKNHTEMKRFLSFVDVSILVLTKNKKLNYLVSFDENFDGLITRIY